VEISIEGARVDPGVVSDNLGKDCGDDGMRTMGDDCNITGDLSCEEIWEKIKACRGKDGVVQIGHSKEGCDKIRSCTKQMNRIKADTPQCFDEDWVNDNKCYYYLGLPINGSRITKDTRFMRGIGESTAKTIIANFDKMTKICDALGW
jgi:hypothetical protein